MLRLWIISGLMMLAACSQADAPPPLPATDAPSMATVTDAPAAAMPLTFSGGNPQVLSDNGRFDLSVTGAVISQMDSGLSVYSAVMGRDDRLRHQLFFSATVDGASQQITLQFDPSITAGEYALNAPTTTIPGLATAQYARLGSDGFDAQVLTFADEVIGTLTLAEVGDVIAGNLEFRAVARLNTAQGEAINETVIVAGTFSDIPFSAVAGDPFEVRVPLPTRNVTGTAEP